MGREFFDLEQFVSALLTEWLWCFPMPPHGWLQPRLALR
jgi:hypothetical protein